MISLSEIFSISNIADFIRAYFIAIYTYYMALRIVNKTEKLKKALIFTVTIPIAIIYSILVLKTNFALGIIFLDIVISLILSKTIRINLSSSIVTGTISLSINYALYFISVCISYVLNSGLKLNNDILKISVIVIVYSILEYLILKIKRFKNGFPFVQKTLGNNYLEILILNIGLDILFIFILLKKYLAVEIGKTVILSFVISATIMIYAIIKSIQQYYQQRQLEKNLEETQNELKHVIEEKEEVEKEQLETSQKMHSLDHKQKVLKYKIYKLEKAGNIKEKDRELLKEELEEIAGEMYQEPNGIELDKTEIELIDDTLGCMQQECIKNNISFELQILGNIHYMVNHLITEEELQILLSDHIKDAIIAINSCNNTNRSIMVRLGKIDEIYSLYIYDSGIEFTKEVLDKIGKEPITTHKETGGTGMGFINTFETLRKYKASLIINEIGKTCVDNYTKALVIKFDNKNEFKVTSYKDKIENI